PKITDFGLAKRLDASAADLTKLGALLGTPAYMAPEQARGLSCYVGPAADIWSLGVILYECLTGRPPFQAESPLEVLRLVAANERLFHQLYVTRANLGLTALRDRRPLRLQELLREMTPGPGEPDHRGFEWHYLRHRLGADLPGFLVGGLNPGLEGFERPRFSR